MSESELKGYLFSTASGDKWRKITTSKRAGVLVPLFSVYSRNSQGIGDLADLRLLIEWLAATHQSLLQLLPMNEAGSLFCPYDALSSFALEPAYISLKSISPFKINSIASEIENLKKIFPCGKAHVDYSIKKAKMRLLWEIYAREGEYNFGNLKRFRQDNAYWLSDFTLYKVLKDYHSGRAWWEWEDKYKHRNASALEEFQGEHEREIAFQAWVQWLVYEQFKAVKKFAALKKVLLKGDLPLLVSRDSADVWAHPEFFKLDFTAGAPPDMYCARGQRWGMPPYNWDKIAGDGYRYLQEKLKFAEELYDILRVDHVVGLFRIWSIPYDEPEENQGLKGVFDPADESKWEAHGRKILAVILKSTKMLLCAEDLGTIPPGCPKVLKEMGIPGSNVQRWTKDWSKTHDFLEPQEYRPLSVAVLSTHDTANWPAWWESEAGTVDEAFFMGRCKERGIDFSAIKEKLFNPQLSFRGRLRWKDSVDSVESLLKVLGKKKEEVKDFIEMYQNTFGEKEKLWKHLKLKGPMREKSDPEILRQALRISLDSKAIFCINTIIDWLYLADVW
ncbi:MAG: 4-alpha-glucanotransferase, partial [Candidatus Omnitrophota bacterium]|nr:4-alpha-glucanotransferase [Candidatus Omnitrophota bacterium]